MKDILFLIRASSLEALSPFAREKEGNGGAFISYECRPTASSIEALEGIVHQYLYGEPITDISYLPAIEKGVEKESEALEELSRILGEKIVKNTVRLSNWQLGLTGEIDAESDALSTIFDIKNAQFPKNFRDMKKTEKYDLQLTAYVMLWNEERLKKGLEPHKNAKLAMFLLDNDINDFQRAVNELSKNVDRFELKNVTLFSEDVKHMAFEITNKYCYSLDKKIACYNTLADWADSYLNLNIKPVPAFRGVPMALRYNLQPVEVTEIKKGRVRAIVENCHRWLEINRKELYKELKIKKLEDLF